MKTVLTVWQIYSTIARCAFLFVIIGSQSKRGKMPDLDAILQSIPSRTFGQSESPGNINPLQSSSIHINVKLAVIGSSQTGKSTLCHTFLNGSSNMTLIIIHQCYRSPFDQYSHVRKEKEKSPEEDFSNQTKCKISLRVFPKSHDRLFDLKSKLRSENSLRFFFLCPIEKWSSTNVFLLPNVVLQIDWTPVKCAWFGIFDNLLWFKNFLVYEL